MNLILLAKSDWIGHDHVILDGRRYLHLIRVLKAQVGDAFRVGALNDKIGTGTVESIDEVAQKIILRVALSEDPPLPSPVTLVLAMPRPLVFKRALAHAITLGVKRIVIIGSVRVEKSYFHTPLLEDDALEKIATEALEQAVDTVLPEIRVHTTWCGFAERESAFLSSGAVKFLAHPQTRAKSERLPEFEKGKAILLAIGPEGGFVDHEIAQFESWGFRRFSLGERILRVEAAVCTAIGRICF